MKILRDALAEEAFCDFHCTWRDHHPDCFMARIEPVAWLRQRDNTLAVNDGGLFGSDWTPLYTHPPQRKPLTEEERERMLEDYATHGDIVRAVEKAHGIGD
jgi:hypothetical protein